MNNRISGFALAAFLAVATVGCGSSGGGSPAVVGNGIGPGAMPDTKTPPVSEPDLRLRLLTGTDLGRDYTPALAGDARRDDTGLTGCPALEKLNGKMDSDGLFAVKVKASFSYNAGSTGSSTLTEDLYSDIPAKLSKGTADLFAAYESCPKFTLSSGTSPVQIEIGKAAAPEGVGDERYAQTMTVTSGTSTTIVKQVAVRSGNVMVWLSGSPGLVDKELPGALKKAAAGK
ncbi:hypothetical protein AB0F20_10200 [Streptomyces goshikiensis]|uniref:hypothetical protein n=1 Tax=Streptomyces goshikiensis TaxID=1942 RepID=UPI0033EBD91B